MTERARASEGGGAPTRLSERDRRLLDFERDWQRHHGRKAAAIAEHFHISAARYYQLLSRLLDEPAAWDYDPLVVARLRRRREERTRRRTAGQLGHQPRQP